jgi:hypothetical protein
MRASDVGRMLTRPPTAPVILALTAISSQFRCFVNVGRAFQSKARSGRTADAPAPRPGSRPGAQYGRDAKSVAEQQAGLVLNKDTGRCGGRCVLFGGRFD